MFAWLKTRKNDDRSEASKFATTIPILSEQVEIEKRRVEGDRMTIDIQTESEIETVSETLLNEEVDVHRIAVGRRVDARPDIRQDGDTIIIPIIRERLVLKKELFVEEELHIIRKVVPETVTEDVKLRRQRAHVSRKK